MSRYISSLSPRPAPPHTLSPAQTAALYIRVISDTIPHQQSFTPLLRSDLRPLTPSPSPSLGSPVVIYPSDTPAAVSPCGPILAVTNRYQTSEITSREIWRKLSSSDTRDQEL
ncbi:hypothetical protein PBY51_001195 [Eleginops maclovinus]|uniref:Uncharacterized protein n=1 Tax=Eleginops maclovinus TaxID=56733 RepID=A0AAN8AIT5_ELEMC|nr:hypothetical protein PBY51_001195 [Eleginops maclovinus]